MTTVRRIARLFWEATTARHTVVDELKHDPGVADDGLIGFAVIGTVVIGLSTFELIPTLVGPIVSPLTALFAAFVLRLVTHVAGHSATLAQTTAAVTLPSLPLLLIPIPVVGAPIGIAWWLLAGIFVYHRITLARLDGAAVLVLFSHALTIGVVFGAGYAVSTFT